MERPNNLTIIEAMYLNLVSSREDYLTVHNAESFDILRARGMWDNQMSKLRMYRDFMQDESIGFGL